MLGRILSSIVAMAALAAPALAQPTDGEPVAPAWTPVPEAKPLSAEAPLLSVAPDWESRPDAAALADFYPDRALKEHVGASTKIRCAITKRGTLADCVIEAESPRGYGFGRLAIMSARFYRMRPQTPYGASVEGFSIEIPTTWPPR